jgi:curved DNA-binding protein CbpA
MHESAFRHVLVNYQKTAGASGIILSVERNSVCPAVHAGPGAARSGTSPYRFSLQSSARCGSCAHRVTRFTAPQRYSRDDEWLCALISWRHAFKMKYRDYYEILGLQRDATQDGVKRAYRKLARKYHPDLSKQADAEDRFKEVGAAYNVLKDTEKRAAYDRMGSQWRDGQDFQPPPQWDENFEFTGKGNNGHGSTDFDDFFEAMFGGEHGGPHARHANGRARRADHGAQEAGDLEDAYSGGAQCPMPGQDHHARITIDLEEAYRGAQRAISLDTPVLDAQGHVSLQSCTLNGLKITLSKTIRSSRFSDCAGQPARPKSS